MQRGMMGRAARRAYSGNKPYIVYAEGKWRALSGPTTDALLLATARSWCLRENSRATARRLLQMEAHKVMSGAIGGSTTRFFSRYILKGSLLCNS